MSRRWAWQQWSWTRSSPTIRRAGADVLLVEQDAEEVLAIADCGYVMEEGRVTVSGESNELANSEEVKKAYLDI
jgi:branched-chain amino acid transport system ATP-binding protein